VSVCVSLLPLLDNGSVKTFPRQRRIVGGVVFYAFRVVSKASRRLDRPRNSCSFFFKIWPLNIEQILFRVVLSFATYCMKLGHNHCGESWLNSAWPTALIEVCLSGFIMKEPWCGAYTPGSPFTAGRNNRWDKHTLTRQPVTITVFPATGSARWHALSEFRQNYYTHIQLVSSAVPLHKIILECLNRFYIFHGKEMTWIFINFHLLFSLLTFFSFNNMKE
jgi:hypothetical protein